MRLAIAKITKPHGIKGEVRANVLLDAPELFCRVKEAYLAGRRVKIRARIAGDAAILSIEGVLTRDDAELLRGQTLEVDRRDAENLKKGEFFISDLVGMTAFAGEKAIGKISEVIKNPRSADIFVIEGEREIMLPFLKKLNARADLNARTIVFDEIAFSEAAVYED